MNRDERERAAEYKKKVFIAIITCAGTITTQIMINSLLNSTGVIDNALARVTSSIALKPKEEKCN